MRPVGKGDVTDDDGVQSFVGTLQYSSPEFLLRHEEDSTEGWRALTFYQIGAVMHDLIMRKRIFEESTQPYARLVNAVQKDTPTIASKALPNYLIETAKICLVKDPKLRIEYVSWASFHPPETVVDQLKAVRERVSKRAVAIEIENGVNPHNSDAEINFLEGVISQLKVKVRSLRSANQAAFPPVTVIRDGNLLLVEFDPSDAHFLGGTLKIWFSVSVLDVAASLIQINACGLLTTQNTEGPSEWHLVYRGLPSSGDFVSAIEACMYIAMDQAQQLSAADVEQVLNLEPLTGALSNG